jgi:hypothetical protein
VRPENRGSTDIDCDDALVAELQAGNERLFTELVERWSGMMLRLALSHVVSRAVAEEVVQDAWLTVIRSLNHCERRSALRTWVLGIVINLARSRARTEKRSIPSESTAPVVDAAFALARGREHFGRGLPRLVWAMTCRPTPIGRSANSTACNAGRASATHARTVCVKAGAP